MSTAIKINDEPCSAGRLQEFLAGKRFEDLPAVKADGLLVKLTMGSDAYFATFHRDGQATKLAEVDIKIAGPGVTSAAASTAGGRAVTLTAAHDIGYTGLPSRNGVHVSYRQRDAAYGSVAVYTTKSDGADKSMVVSTSPMPVNIANRLMLIGKASSPTAFGSNSIVGTPLTVAVRILVNKGTAQAPVWHEAEE
nr:uncharacterized protein CTRU02_05529 [Colletotrichum truncatum]KAF6793972.1 hypothetical protein CTRU02_05529 [Colletotrichum truncatum]